ncbi:MAG TPA: ATP-binding protein [Herpetosiphonaceae bacterium]
MGLLVLAISGVVIIAVRQHQRFADEQARARVTQAGAAARQALGGIGADVRVLTQLLSERPTLLRLLQENDPAGLAAFLDQFRSSSRLSGFAVLRAGAVVQTSGAAAPWLELAAAQETDEALLYAPAAGPLLLAARSRLLADPSFAVIGVRQLDTALAGELSAELGLAITIWQPAEALAAANPDEAILRRAALGGQAGSARIPARGRYLAAVPLANGQGRVLGLIEAELPLAGVAGSVREFVTTLVGLTVLLALVAAALSLLLGRRLSASLRQLTAAASRIGRGDLHTPISQATGAEIGTLAASFEEMRYRLLQLTADLRRQQHEAQAIITGIVEGVFTVDRERRIRYLNPQAASMLGIEPQAAIGRFCGDVLNPVGPGGERPCQEHCPIIHARFRGGTRAIEHLLLADGSRRSVVITSSELADEQQVQVLRDETEIEATRRLRDAVLANVSHEFRTPLSAQLASIELLLDQLPDLTTEQIGQLIGSLQRGTLRLTQLIDNLLESARIEAGQHAIRRRTIALDEVVEEALELARPLLGQRSQRAAVDLPYPLPPVVGDSPRLVQVFVNLLANANKYAPAGSTITIGGAVAEAAVTIWVADEGPGMPALTQESMFSQFVRAAAEEPEQSGFGLGLWIVKSIVERHDGRIYVQPGQPGTRMCVELPRKDNDEDLGCR